MAVGFVAQSINATLSYVHQACPERSRRNHLTSTSLMTDATGAQIGTMVKYLPFGEARAAIDIPTDKLFTGQRLDSTGLYYYNARYYDATIGRFISADSIIPNWRNPPAFNRYSYVYNNPLKYIDPSGKFSIEEIKGLGISKYNINKLIYEMLRNAQLNDKLIVSYADGSVEVYYFSWDNRYLGWDPGAGINVTTSDGTAVSASDTLCDDNITEIRLERPLDLGDITTFDPEYRDGYHLAEYVDVLANLRIHRHGNDYAEQFDNSGDLPGLLKGIASLISSTFDPAIDAIPSEYMLAGAAMLGLTGPGGAIFVLAIYLGIWWGPDLLTYWANYLENHPYEDPQ